MTRPVAQFRVDVILGVSTIVTDCLAGICIIMMCNDAIVRNGNPLQTLVQIVGPVRWERKLLIRVISRPSARRITNEEHGQFPIAIEIINMEGLKPFFCAWREPLLHGDEAFVPRTDL